MAETLHLQRDLILSLIQLGFLLEPGLNSLKTAPFTADTLFWGRIQAAVTADREDQIRASLARSNVGPRPGALKRPAPKSPAQGPAAKKAKKNTFFNRRSSIPPPAPRRPSSYQRPPGKKVDPSRIRRCQSLLLARAALLRVSPRGPPFLPPPPPMQEIPVGARLLHFKQRLLQITSDALVLSLVSRGLTFQFERRPPLSRVPIELVSQHQYIPDSIRGLLEKQAVERVQDPHSPGFYSRLFLVQKKSSSWRPVIDLKVFNTFLLKPTFKMETPAFIRKSLRPMQWGVSLDLEDAFFNVPIHSNFRKYLRFAFQGQVYQFRAMPFGLAIAPQVFTKLMAAVGAHLRVHRVLLLQYFDDWLLHQLDHQLLLQNLEFAWKELLSFGLLLNANTSDLIPSLRFYFRGNGFSDPPQPGQGLAPTSVRHYCTGQMGPNPIPHHSSGFPISQRYPDLCSQLRATRTVVSPSSAALPVISMGLVSGQSACTDSHTSTLSSAPSMVAGRGDSFSWSAPPPPHNLPCTS